MAELEPVFLDGLDATAQELRTAYSALQAGVMGAGDLKVNAGAGNTVDVYPGVAFVPLSVADGGLVRCRETVIRNSNGFSEGGSIPPANGVNPRVDQIVARVFDVAGSRRWRIMTVSGLATAGATIDNRAGAAALPADSLRLADRHLAVNGAATLRDRRPWARGAHKFIRREANSFGNAHYLRSSNVATLVDTANLYPRIECSGVPLLVRFDGDAFAQGAEATMGLTLFVDGTFLNPDNIRFLRRGVSGSHFGVSWEFSPTTGSHQIGPAFWSTDNVTSMALAAGAGEPLLLTVEETLRQNASND